MDCRASLAVTDFFAFFIYLQLFQGLRAVSGRVRNTCQADENFKGPQPDKFESSAGNQAAAG